MKRINYGMILGIAFSLLIWSSLLFATTRNIGDSHEVKYTPLDTTGTLITSQTITLKIEKSSNSYTYNFVNSTFDNTSNNDTVNLAEGDDFYSYSWTPPLTETDSEEYNFIVSNANTTYKDKQTETISYLSKVDFSLANDSITSSTFDESTAFPLAYNDGGTTKISRVGAGNDTLETISDQLDAIGDATDGNKEDGSYTGIESMIRRN